jgi:hypothetical protein
VFVIEDEAHAEPQEGSFRTEEEAIAELERRASIPWNEKPNCAPCANWRNCGRRYEIVEYDDTVSPRVELSRKFMLAVSAKGAEWQQR